MGEDEGKQAKQAENDLEPLKNLLHLMESPGKEAAIRHMTAPGGVLRPLGDMLNELLKDPVLRQAMGNKPPEGTQTH